MVPVPWVDPVLALYTLVAISLAAYVHFAMVRRTTHLPFYRSLSLLIVVCHLFSPHNSTWSKRFADTWTYIVCTFPTRSKMPMATSLWLNQYQAPIPIIATRCANEHQKRKQINNKFWNKRRVRVDRRVKWCVVARVSSIVCRPVCANDLVLCPASMLLRACRACLLYTSPSPRD